MNQRKHILLVEGDPKTASKILEAFKGSKYEVQIVSSAEEALMVLETQVADMVISDAETPGLDLRGFLDELLGWDTEMPVLVLEPKKAVRQGEKFLSSHAGGVLAKPVRKEILLRRIGELLNHSPTMGAY